MTHSNSPSIDKKTFSSAHADFPSFAALIMYFDQSSSKSIPPLNPLLKQMLSQISELTVLDLGCGLGSIFIKVLFNYYGLQSKNLYSTDSDQKNLRKDEMYKRENKILASADILPFADNKFDIVHTCMLTPDNPSINYQKTLEEISRVLKPDGFYICFEAFDKAYELKKQEPEYWKNTQDLLPLVSDNAFLENIGFKPMQKPHYLFVHYDKILGMFYIFEKL